MSKMADSTRGRKSNGFKSEVTSFTEEDLSNQSLLHSKMRSKDKNRIKQEAGKDVGTTDAQSSAERSMDEVTAVKQDCDDCVGLGELGNAQYSSPPAQSTTAVEAQMETTERQNDMTSSDEEIIGLCSSSTPMLLSMSRKRRFKQTFKYEELVAVDMTRQNIEKEILCLAMKKIKAEKERIEAERQMMIKKREVLELEKEILLLKKKRFESN